MQCVILAAGKGTRMRPLTNTTPKPLVQIDGKPLVEHILVALPDAITEIIFVVGYKREQIMQRYGTSFSGKRIRYVWQRKYLGTANALCLTRKMLRGSFLVLCADDLIGPQDLERGIRHDLCVFVATHAHPERFGVILENKDGTLFDIVEKPKNPQSSLVSTGAMVLDERIFHYRPIQHENGEYFLPAMIKKLSREHVVHVVRQNFWVPVGTLKDLSHAENILRAEKSIEVK